MTAGGVHIGVSAAMNSPLLFEPFFRGPSFVMAVDESAGGDGIVARKDIRSVADLRGKKVAFQRGLPSEFFLRALLLDAKMSLNNLQTVDMETAQASAAFISGRIGAAVVWEPWLSKAAEAGGGHVLASTREFPNLIVDVLAFNDQFVQQKPKDVQAIINAVLKAIEYWKTNPKDADKIMAPYFQITPEKYEALLGGLRFMDLTRNRKYFGQPSCPISSMAEQKPAVGAEGNQASVRRGQRTRSVRPGGDGRGVGVGAIFAMAQKASDIWLESGMIEAPIFPEKIITSRFLGAAGDQN